MASHALWYALRAWATSFFATYVAKNDVAQARKAYQSAWDAIVARKQERQILQIKLESVGVLVNDPDIERPILKTQVDES